MAAILERLAIRVRPTGAAFGADIEDVDLARRTQSERPLPLDASHASQGRPAGLRL
jgi:hypothetical protein